MKRFLQYMLAHFSCVNSSHMHTLADSCLHQTPPQRHPCEVNMPVAARNAVTL